MSVAEYRDKFIQLSWYAPTEVEDDEKRQELFMEGLNDGLSTNCYLIPLLVFNN